MTLLLYGIFRPVDGRLALLALFCGLVGLTFEALRQLPGRVNASMIFHGRYCLLTGHLMFRTHYLPRISGALMALACLVWLIYLSPSITRELSPYNSACGLLGEALPMLWLLVMGVNVPPARGLAGVTEG